MKPCTIEFIDIEATVEPAGLITIHDWLAVIDGEIRNRLRYSLEHPEQKAYVDQRAVLIVNATPSEYAY